jgi:glycosyltransferase 2 family protein
LRASIARLLPRPHRRAVLALQIVFAAAVVWFAGRTIRDKWTAIEQAQLTIAPHWPWIILSTVIVLAMYLVLVEVWVIQLRAWGQRLPFIAAARIWFIANLGKYIPGKVVGLGTMFVLAERRGISPIAAVGSSVLATLIGVVAGLAVVMMTGANVVDVVLESNGTPVPRWVIGAVVAVSVVALLVAPLVVPRLAGIVARLSDTKTVLPSLPATTVWLVAAASALAWTVYGVAFQLFALGMLGHAAGGPSAYVAVYTASYLAGLLSLIPGGLVVREAALVLGLAALNLATTPEAALLALTSRLWLTVLELLPGFFFLLTRPEGRAFGEGTAASSRR